MLVGVLARLQSEGRVVDATKLPEEEEQRDRSGKEIEDTVPDHLGCGGDDVATFRQSPTDGVCQKHEGEVAGSSHVLSAESTVGSESSATTVPEKHVPMED